MRGIRAGAATALTLLALASAACAPTRAQHGYLPETEDFAGTIAVGADTKSSVLARLGSPSTTGALDENAWYYITSVQQSTAFLQPDTTARQVVAVRFGTDDVVSAVETFGLDKGRVINYSDDKTPTRGRELGLLEQLFGNVGRTPTQIGAEETGREDRR